MTDIFFSYSAKDRERVRPVHAALTAMGFDVLWDRLGHLDPPAPQPLEMRLGFFDAPDVDVSAGYKQTSRAEGPAMRGDCTLAATAVRGP
jgi:hypothetical protein